MDERSPKHDLFDRVRLPPELDGFLRSINPWWIGEPAKPVPPFRRWAYGVTLRKLNSGLSPAVVLRGPRQVGKSTIQSQIIDHLLHQERVSPRRILHVQFDEIPALRDLKDPIWEVAQWFQNRILGRTFNAAAASNEHAYLFLDEVQNLRDWAPQVKSLVDHHELRVLLTGSSALRIETGRDSLAGRVSQVDLGTLLLREISSLRFGESIAPLLGENGPEPLREKQFWEAAAKFGRDHAGVRDRAFSAFSQSGGFPLAHKAPSVPWSEVADQLNETVVKRAIQHDLRIGDRGRRRDASLLEEVFRLACRYAGQAPGAETLAAEISQSLHANVGVQRVREYLRFLDSAMLVRLVDPMELRLKRRKGFPKICLCDHGVRAAWLQEPISLDPGVLADRPGDRDLAGHIAESALGYFFSQIPHLDVAHFPSRPNEPEIDFVLGAGDRRIPVEVKYRRRIDPHKDTHGLRAFIEKSAYNAPFGLLVTLVDHAEVDDPRIVQIPLRSLLLIR